MAEVLPLEDVEGLVLQAGRAARQASQTLALSDTAARNGALLAIAAQLQAAQEEVAEANRKDLEAARAAGLEAPLLDRLELTPGRYAAMIEGVKAVSELPDPIGEIIDVKPRPSGIRVGKMHVPLGVIGIIYESRPAVTIDAAVLCLKAGNAVLLRGGSEALHSNQALGRCIRSGLQEAGLPAAAVYVLETADRTAVSALLRMSEYLDLVVPRGGKGLVARVDAEARVPVLKHLDGVCHVYIDAAADPDTALAIALNAKTQRYAVCNAMETLLVDRAIAGDLLPHLADAYREAGVELRACAASREIVPGLKAATEQDWGEEYLGPVLAVRVVDGLEQAIEHINTWGSRHTDCIVTRDDARARRFLRAVDSSSVMVNASTRFADGFEYGLGAEIGISTDKLHARGPVGLQGLTSCKYIVLGDGQVRS